MFRIFGFLLPLVFLASAVSAMERPQGLLWHRSGKPATLPLQVKTDAGADYVLHLRDAETGRVVLAAYVRGGEFFRVLAPPGSFELTFFRGTAWRGEAALFGPETRRFTLDRPLAFEATVRRKNGHLVDLRGGGDIAVRGFALCQRLKLDQKSLRRLRDPDPKPRARPDQRFHPPSRFVFPRYELQARVCD